MEDAEKEVKRVSGRDEGGLLHQLRGRIQPGEGARSTCSHFPLAPCIMSETHVCSTSTANILVFQSAQIGSALRGPVFTTFLPIPGWPEEALQGHGAVGRNARGRRLPAAMPAPTPPPPQFTRNPSSCALKRVFLRQVVKLCGLVIAGVINYPYSPHRCTRERSFLRNA